MALADLMRKGFLTSATATPAAIATHREANRRTVATVAAVAVAKPAKARTAMPSVAAVAGLAVAKRENHKTAITAESLAQFRFDLVQAEFDAGQSVNELQRVNNLAWEFMTADGLTFEQAIKLAAEIVVHCAIADCEAAYADVQALWNRLRTNQSTPNPPKAKND